MFLAEIDTLGLGLHDLKNDKSFYVNFQVETELDKVTVAGCKPPWYLWWFKQWEKLLNEGVREAFEEYANNFEHQVGKVVLFLGRGDLPIILPFVFL